ncbi:MAG: Cof-type HAD-IIB family hydrolase [Planctomycetes bacterium]|nr:Cof-type HAD-IIB family hydrolase [Planctomycetota bacterium]
MTREGRAAIRAVVTDVDGTLLRRDLTISPRCRDTIARISAAGVPVILATGRIPNETVGYYHELGLATPLVCYHGAMVLAGGWAASGRLLPDARMMVDIHMADDLPRRLVEFIFAIDSEAVVLVGLADRYVANRVGELHRHWDMKGPSRPEIGSLNDVLSQRVYKICYFSMDRERVQEVSKGSAARFSEGISFQQAHGTMAEMVAAGASKVAGVDAALRSLGIEWSETLAVGDFHNDVEMVRRAAIGVAMGNAVDELKAVADFVTTDRDEDGMATALERFVLNGNGGRDER